MADDNNKSTINDLPSNEVVDSVLGGPDDFFAALDSQFNGAMQEQPAETIVDASTQSNGQVTQNNPSDPNATADSNTDWKKRYGDSTKQNQELSQFKKENEPFVPIIDALKKDPKLVDTVQQYLQGGGKTPQSIQEKLGLDESFVFDMNEAMSTPDSDSAKVLTQMIEGTVSHRVEQAVQSEKKKVTDNRKAQSIETERVQFMENHNMTNDEFEGFAQQLNEHILSFEDMFLILNRDQANQNIAQNTRNAYQNQVESVRKMPVTASGTNSSGSSVKSDEDAIFDSLMGVDGGADNLFG